MSRRAAILPPPRGRDTAVSGAASPPRRGGALSSLPPRMVPGGAFPMQHTIAGGAR